MPVTHRATLGDHSFPVAATRAWNALPGFVTTAPNVALFSAALKTTDNRRHTNSITCSWSDVHLHHVNRDVWWMMMMMVMMMNNKNKNNKNDDNNNGHHRHVRPVFFNLFSEVEPFAAILIAHGTHVFWGRDSRGPKGWNSRPRANRGSWGGATSTLPMR